MKFTPHGRQVAVIKKIERVSTIIETPSLDKISDHEGTIAAVSDWVAEHYPEVAVGVAALFSEYSGSTMDIGGKDYVFMDIDCVLAVISD